METLLVIQVKTQAVMETLMELLVEIVVDVVEETVISIPPIDTTTPQGM